MFSSDGRVVLGHAGPLPIFPAVHLGTHDRAGHILVIGKTGMGKSKLLAALIAQDIAAGRGVAVIDPHSDLVTDLVGLLDRAGLLERHRDRILCLDPSQRRYVVPWNVLATRGDPYDVAQSVIEAFRRTWPGSLAVGGSPHFENVMLHALLVLIRTGNRLTDLPRFLTEWEYREALLQQAHSEELARYFHTRFDLWTKKDPRLLESSLNKVTALTLNPYLRRMLGCSENRLNFRDLMDQSKVLVCDLGRCGHESQRFIGNLITTGFEQAVFTRADTPDRPPFYLYVDEFQNYMADGREGGSARTFTSILSGARKFGLSLCISNHNLGQLSPQMTSAILGNVWTKIVFGVSEPDAFTLARFIGLGQVDPNAIKHAAQTDGQHPLFQPLQEQWNQLAARLASQKPRRAFVRYHNGRVRRLWVKKVDTRVPADRVRAFRQQAARKHGKPTADRGDITRRAVTPVPEAARYDPLEPEDGKHRAGRQPERPS